MPNLAIKTISTPEGYDFVRSDGQHFYLVGTENGHAVLYLGKRRGKPPALGIVDLDVGIPDKLAAARRWVLAYPENPD